MTAYYNENNPVAAKWLENLISAGELPAGQVDRRDIRDVTKNDLKGFTQLHFFAGIGGWPLAGRMAGWPDTRPIRTGSCPCGPFSVIGARKAFEDERDLWPVWHDLMEPDGVPVFGEQVADCVALGWFDRAADDLGKLGYASWAAVLPSCATGQANKGERLFFVAAPDISGLERHAWDVDEIEQGARQAGHAAPTALCDFIKGWDGLFRPTPSPSVPLLADGLPEFMVRAYSEGFGNAINPTLGAEFIRACMLAGL